MATVMEVVGGVLHRVPASFAESDGLDRTEGWDSLCHMTILTSVENALDIQFSAAELLEIQTVSDIVAVAHSKI